ncbi:uncharacterized protein LOC142169852 [Nicotiana tabacum]|uniref:Uncharacterized protein LOC142169852 n=1 Tax=Nicotiana tabacum TaxID=4097 RepID=A0AC58SSF0_TOBAC
MKLALQGKSKLGFMDGSCVKSRYRGELLSNWKMQCNSAVMDRKHSFNELMPSIVYASDARKMWNDFQKRFNRSNLTRIYHLWTEIATMRQGTDSITSYYTRMKDLWDELDVLAHLSCCDYEDARPSIKVLKS